MSNHSSPMRSRRAHLHWMIGLGAILLLAAPTEAAPTDVIGGPGLDDVAGGAGDDRRGF